MKANTIPLERLERFIKVLLRKKIKQDLRRLLIIKEADLACCVYHHLRRFLNQDKTWRVFAQRLSYVTGHYIDVLIFREKAGKEKHQQLPRIAIELKWNRDRIFEKDRRSLNKALTRLKVEKAYFISALTEKMKIQRVEKDKSEKYRLIEIAIPLGFTGSRLKKWKEDRALFMKNMSLGKRAKV